MDLFSNILKQRLAAGQSVAGSHPDSDLLTAFVERSLGQRERQSLLGHLAACSQCRHAVALAMPERAESQLKHTRAFTFRFPAAMRWAAATAMVAVAVGVGILSYEHQPERQNAAVKSAALEASAPTIATQNPAPTQAAPVAQKTEQTAELRQQPALAQPPPHNQQVSNHAIVAAKAQPLQSGRNRLIEKDAETQAENKALARVAAGDVPRPPVAVVEMSSAIVTQPGVPSQNEPGLRRGAPPVTAVASAPTRAELQENRVNVEGPIAGTAGRNTLDVASAANMPLPAAAEAYTGAKSAGFSAIGGATMKRSAAAFNEIVSWTITTAGKLQRQFRGAVKLVEPAPGVVVRAVAARGIEVWAGGSQPDLAATQWQQAPALFHSSDAGETWTRVDGPWHGQITRLNLNSPTSLTVIAQDGTWVSHDAGKTWSAP